MAINFFSSSNFHPLITFIDFLDKNCEFHKNSPINLETFKKSNWQNLDNILQTFGITYIDISNWMKNPALFTKFLIVYYNALEYIFAQKLQKMPNLANAKNKSGATLAMLACGIGLQSTKRSQIFSALRTFSNDVDKYNSNIAKQIYYMQNKSLPMPQTSATINGSPKNSH